MTDDQLRTALAALRGGDRAAFEDIYRGLSTPVYTVLLRMTRERQSAEDLLQETFLKLYRQPPGEEVRSPRAWIFRVARNLALDYLRAARPGVPLEGADRAAPERDHDARLDVEAALDRLSGEERALVTLHLNGGLKFRELAQVLDLPLGTVLRRYYAALDKLRGHLSESNGRTI